MKWFRILLTTAAVFATVAVGIWLVYAVLGAEMDDVSRAVSLSAGFAAVALGGSAGAALVASKNGDRHE